MNKKGTAVIQFVGYRVTDISYSCNAAFEFPRGEIAYKFNFSKSAILISEKEMQENVRVNVFFSDDDNMDNAPYKLSVEIAGKFVCDSEWQPHWETNALAILFPYLRNLVSMVTCNSGREPFILPTVNIASMFED